MSATDLAAHAFLSDCRSAALVTARGSVDWLCLPRFDSPSVFARVLDDRAGHFLLAPADDDFVPTWRYRTPSLVLETTWSGLRGELQVTDGLALGSHERGHELGRTSPGVLLRRAQCTWGAVQLRVEFVPRPEYGLIHPVMTQLRGMVVADGGAQVLRLSTDAELRLETGSATGVFELREGEELTFALEHADPWEPPGHAWSARNIRRRLEDTVSAWQSWSELHQRYSGPFRDLVLHSGVVLQGLTYARSGAVVAAPTTSLPEGVGTGRTWDYRYTWVRDASMTLQGLYVAACPDEAHRFFAFIARAAASQLHRGVPLQIMFGIGGERDLAERELPHLAGWRDSAPVRVGNEAWQQGQTDVYGALLDAAWTLRDQLSGSDTATRSFLGAAVQAAADRWQEDDQGIWEFRGPARPFLHSKLMCWVALDRGIRLVDEGFLADASLSSWRAARDEVRREIETRGWNAERGAFTQSFGAAELDASVLLMAVVGFLPGDDPRLRSTIDAIEEGLSDERRLLRRYDGEDDLTGQEGSFLLCTFWLAHALAVTGQVDRAYAVLERAAACRSELGLFAEQVDSATGELLGNYPQAFSHLGLINAAAALVGAERTRLEEGPAETPCDRSVSTERIGATNRTRPEEEG